MVKAYSVIMAVNVNSEFPEGVNYRHQFEFAGSIPLLGWREDTRSIRYNVHSAVFILFALRLFLSL